MKSSVPLVSVIMCVYNGEAFVKNAIESILKQTFLNWELIICDDGSTDKTLSILETYAENPKIQVLKNKKNLGPGKSRNQCLKVAESDYIVIQDADDTSQKDRLSTLYNEITKQSASALGSGAILKDKNHYWGIIIHKPEPKKLDWIKSMQVVHASIIAKREDLLEVGGYGHSKKDRSEDYDLMCRLAAKNKKIINIPTPLYIINYGREDYKRRTALSRLFEVKAKFKVCRYIMPSLPYYIYCFKPLLLALIPKKLQFMIHKRIFYKNKVTANISIENDSNPNAH